MNGVDSLARKIFSAFLHCYEKNLKKMSFVSFVHLRVGSLNFNFPIASIKSNYGDIFSFPNKLKFDESNICTNVLIRDQKIINNNLPGKLISLKSYV